MWNCEKQWPIPAIYFVILIGISLYSVALYKLTGDKDHRHVGLRAAELLAQRFNPQGNFIRAFVRWHARRKHGTPKAQVPLSKLST